MATLARALEPLGHKPRVVLEPLDTITDAEIDALLALAPSERFGGCLDWGVLLDVMAEVPFAVAGPAAARFYGAPCRCGTPN